MNENDKRKVDINNFDNVGKILKVEYEMISKFVKTRVPVLNREGKDLMAPELARLQMSLYTVLNHLEGRIKELEKSIEKNKEEK